MFDFQLLVLQYLQLRTMLNFKTMKKIQNHTTFIILLLFALGFSACEDVVQVDLNDENLDLISVEAYLTTSEENNILVKLEKSLPVDDSQQNPPINNAIVEITDNEAKPNTIVLEEQGNSGIYQLSKNIQYPAIPGRTYNITITTPDGVIITGEEYLQKVEPLDTVKVNLSARGDYEYLAVFVSTQETPGPGHYYKWDIYINNRLLYESDNLAYANDELVDGNYVYDLEIFTDWYEDGDDNEEESDRILFIGDTVTVVQSSISQSSYDFYLGMQNQAFAGGPFSVPPANILGNLSSTDDKKVLGFFSARDISTGNPVIIDEENFKPLSAQ